MTGRILAEQQIVGRDDGGLSRLEPESMDAVKLAVRPGLVFPAWG